MAWVIKIDQNQGGTTSEGTPGVARDDLWNGGQVTLTAVWDSGAPPVGTHTYLWEFLDQPAGSETEFGDSESESATFTPEAYHSFRIRLKVDGGGSGKTDTTIAAVTRDADGVRANRGWRFPAFDEDNTDSNFSSNEVGWKSAIENVFRSLLNYGIIGDLPHSEQEGGIVAFSGDPITGGPDMVDGSILVRLDPSSAAEYIYFRTAGAWVPLSSGGDFGSQNITTTGFIGVGATPRAASGALRSANGTTIIAARNAADDADLSLLRTDGSDNVYLGNSTGVWGVYIQAQSGGTTGFNIGGGHRFSVTTSTATFNLSSILIAKAQTSPSLVHEAQTTDTGVTDLLIRSQGPWALSSGANRNTSNMKFDIPTPAAGGGVGSFQYHFGGTNVFRIVPGTTAVGMFAGGAINDFSFSSDNATGVNLVFRTNNSARGAYFDSDTTYFRTNSGASTGFIFVPTTSTMHLGSSTSAAFIRSGAGSPEGVVTAPVASLFLRIDGSAGTCLYQKETGTGNTGWVATTSEYNATSTHHAAIVIDGGAALTQRATTGAGSTKSQLSAKQYEISTTDETVTTIATIAGVPSAVMDVTGVLVAIKSDGTAAWKQDISATFHCNGSAVPTKMGGDTTSAAKSNGMTSGLAIAASQSGTNIIVQVTGRAAETWRWGGNLTVTTRLTAP